MSGELFAVLSRALDLWRRSDGAFDPTVGPFVELWRGPRTDFLAVPGGVEPLTLFNLIPKDFNFFRRRLESLVEAQRSVLLDPRDPQVIAGAERNGGDSRSGQALANVGKLVQTRLVKLAAEIREGLNISLSAIWANKLRSILTTLGIIIGILTVSLMAMAIQSLGQPAVSLTGAQVGIVTDAYYTKARIKSISTERIRQALDAGQIVIVAGFQGVDESDNITTLGRGGSDTTAVALAAAEGDAARAMDLLGVSRTTYYRKVKELGLG